MSYHFANSIFPDSANCVKMDSSKEEEPQMLKIRHKSAKLTPKERSLLKVKLTDEDMEDLEAGFMPKRRKLKPPADFPKPWKISDRIEKGDK